MKIWDTAGSEKYMSISTVYYRKADGVVFIFDVTKPRSFTNIETIWMNAVDAPERLALLADKVVVLCIDSEVGSCSRNYIITNAQSRAY